MEYQRSDIIIGVISFLKFSMAVGLVVAGIVGLVLWLGFWSWWVLLGGFLLWRHIQSAKDARERLEARQAE